MMTKQRKYVALGKANLQKCWAWAEANEAHPLAKAYMDSCIGLGGFDLAGIRNSLPGGKNGSPWKPWMKAYDTVIAAQDLGFQFRDSIGRMILDVIKAEVAA